MRRLFGRFATCREKLMGKLSVDHLEELFERSSIIWRAEAEKNQDLKNIVKEKLEIFRHKQQEMSNNKAKAGMRQREQARSMVDEAQEDSYY